MFLCFSAVRPARPTSNRLKLNENFKIGNRCKPGTKTDNPDSPWNPPRFFLDASPISHWILFVSFCFDLYSSNELNLDRCWWVFNQYYIIFMLLCAYPGFHNRAGTDFDAPSKFQRITPSSTIKLKSTAKIYNEMIYKAPLSK